MAETTMGLIYRNSFSPANWGKTTLFHFSRTPLSTGNEFKTLLCIESWEAEENLKRVFGTFVLKNAPDWSWMCQISNLSNLLAGVGLCVKKLISKLFSTCLPALPTSPEACCAGLANCMGLDLRWSYLGWLRCHCHVPAVLPRMVSSSVKMAWSIVPAPCED
jgi:hypothetical protein